jgi:hypothetical protein
MMKNEEEKHLINRQISYIIQLSKVPPKLDVNLLTN